MKGNVKTTNRKKAKSVLHEINLKLTLLVSRERVKGTKPVNLTRVRMMEKVVLTIHGVLLSSTSLMLLLDAGSILISILGLFDIRFSENILTLFLHHAKDE